jgi:hypothetical protein
MAGIVNPKPFLAQLTGNSVLVKLKWGMEYKGAWRVAPLPFLATRSLARSTKLLQLTHHPPRPSALHRRHPCLRRLVHESAARKHGGVHRRRVRREPGGGAHSLQQCAIHPRSARRGGGGGGGQRDEGVTGAGLHDGRGGCYSWCLHACCAGGGSGDGASGRGRWLGGELAGCRDAGCSASSRSSSSSSSRQGDHCCCAIANRYAYTHACK